MWDEHRRRDAEAFGLLDAALDWCAEAGLRAIVDLHILRTHYFTDNPEQRLFTDPAETQRFAGLWTDLSAHLRRRPLDRVAYELMNEPVARDPADWNRVARAGYDAVRREEPERMIVLGSNRWSMPASFHELAVPSGDPHLILTFHFYNPLPVTHYKAYWAPLAKYEGPVHYPGQPVPPHDWPHLSPEMQELLAPWNLFYNAGVMERDLAPPLAVRKETRLPLYCGEFGCINLAPDDARKAWYRDFRSVLEKHGIAWANWDYKGPYYGFFDHGKPTLAYSAMLQ